MIISDFLLFAVFGALFFLESILPSGRGTVIIRSHLLNRWNFSVSANLPFFGEKHISLKTLIPPFGAAFITGSYPVIFSEKGFMKNPFEGRYRSSLKNSYRYTEIKNIGVSGSLLMVNGKNFCKMHSGYEAQWWKSVLVMLGNTSPDDRGRILAELTESFFNKESAGMTIKKIFSAVKPLIRSVSILYFFLFIASPLLISIFNFETVLSPLLSVLLIIHLVTVRVFYKAYRYVFHDRDIPWAEIISMALYPPSLIRSADYFYKDSVIHYSASAVSLVLLNPENSKKLISYLIREYIFFDINTGDSFENEIIDSHRTAMIDGIKKLLGKNSINYNELLEPPAPSFNMESYCPRCFCQYNGNVRRCEDCSVDLVEY